MSAYLLNSWYVAAWSHEVGGAPMRRILLDTPVVFYRKGDGTVAALHDRCPHRFAPLSAGTLQDDKLTCGYHGLTFDAEGRCTHSPFSETIPAAARVRSFTVFEQNRVVWFWPGDPALADPADIPVFDFLDEDTSPQGWMHTKAGYEVAVDNLMDLSHVEFIHKGTFGGSGCFYNGQQTTVQDGDSVLTTWMMPDVDPPPLARNMYPDPGAKCDHWMSMKWSAPACMELTVGHGPRGADPHLTPSMYQAHMVTPETATTCHYFYSNGALMVPATRQVIPLPTRGVSDTVRIAFEQEDKPMLEAVQDNMGDQDFWSLHPVLLAVDQAAVRVRRILQQKIAAEQRARAAA